MRSFIFSTFFLAIILFCENTNAQLILSKPTLGFTQACASPSFNSYNVTFTFSPVVGLSALNQFEIELSDDTGSFANSTVIYTSAAGVVTTSPATLNFSFPTTIAGEGFKLRIKSTVPAATSSSSNAFPAYYKIQDSPFSINNLVSTGIYCAGGSYLLTIDNPGTGTNDSPLQYPSLTFNWYKETSPTTSVFVASGSSLSVNEPGVYFAETNYGSCTSNSYSNRVTISEASGGASANITSSLGNPFCPSVGLTTLSTITGNSYQWYKDGQSISGETNRTYTTSEAGTYTVDINFGGCQESASIALEIEEFSSSIDVSDINIIEPDETLLVTVTTNADIPEYAWYFNDTVISGAVTDSYEVTEYGNYKVVITQTVGCNISSELLFKVQEPAEQFPDVNNIPNLISPNGDGINDLWVIPKEYVSGTNTEVIVISSQGEIVLRTNDYKNNWPENQLNFKEVNPVYYYIITTQNQKVKKGSITVIK